MDKRAVLTVAEVAELLGKSHDRIYEAVALGQIPGAFRMGKRIFFSRAAIERFLAGRAGSEPKRVAQKKEAKRAKEEKREEAQVSGTTSDEYEPVIAFTFLDAQRRMPFVYDEPWGEEEERVFHGRLQLGRLGYFFGMTPWDALAYAPGPIVARVAVRDPYELRDGKGVAGRVRLLSAADATDSLRYFAYECALETYRRIARTDCPPDPRLHDVLDVVFAHIAGRASDEELDAAWKRANDIVFGIAERTMEKPLPERLGYAAAWAAAEAVRAAALMAPWEAAWSAAWSACWAAGYAAAARTGEALGALEDARDEEMARLSASFAAMVERLLEKKSSSAEQPRTAESAASGHPEPSADGEERISASELATWLTPGHAASQLGISIRMVRELIERGKLRSIWTPYGRLIEPESVAHIARERAVRGGK